MRVVVGDSVFEDANVTVNQGTLYIEFEADDLDNIQVDLRQIVEHDPPTQSRL